MSCKVNFHVVRSALQNSVCLLRGKEEVSVPSPLVRAHILEISPFALKNPTPATQAIGTRTRGQGGVGDVHYGIVGRGDTPVQEIF